MELVRPFRALFPRAERAGDVIAPPYDVLSVSEARELAQGRPHSFLHISRPEIDLPEETNPYDEMVYAKALENFQALLASDCMQRDEQAGYYIYRVETNEHSQTGIALTASVEAYRAGRIKKHEHTLPKKETDRVRQIDAINAQTGPVLMAYPDDATVAEIINRECSKPALFRAALGNGSFHSFWPVSDPETIESISQAMNALDALYIADGHHRSAAGERVAQARIDDDTDAAQFFLAVAFPAQSLTILDYNRVVRDLNGLSGAEFLDRISQLGELTTSAQPAKPAAVGQFGIYLEGNWHHLTINPELIDTADPVASLDVSVLTELILAPILNIHDLRNDSRIDFVGGSRGLSGLQSRVDSGDMALAFAMYPTPIDALMAIADAGEVMPPKSTWFEPKLADGVVSHLLD